MGENPHTSEASSFRKRSLHSLNYHLVICIKYRRNIFNNQEIIDELKERTRKIASNYDIEIANQEVDEDHTHILINASLPM